MNTDSWSALLSQAGDVVSNCDDIDRRRIKQLLDDTRTDRLADAQSDTHQPESEPKITEPATEPVPTSVVVDADVLVADFLCGSDTDARQALESLWTHSWMTLFGSDPLLTDAEALIAALTTDQLAREWRVHMTEWCSIVTHPPGDHPALATAYRGGAMHILSFNDQLQSTQVGASLRGQLPVSVREPAAYTAVFSPEQLYDATFDDEGTYPGPDRASRIE
ncbi:MAG: hypothetical protein J07HQW2_02785 [Haloquadratum walsbyi J07HQW2]|uniref:PIN domain-containing protein n=1 Tax=Haloquadratum walsbyi J07HQW2 TaxID=1238425 RepID=U1N0I5_9EURY|nr:PIN domain-containing protein [Haloquadratum walsbyi]ERG96309.1 MAG: hypothetical protein J07HQW2_02785 [Haloquadratum walsbyi J07HQW2]